MGKTVVLAEKPSVGRELARVLDCGRMGEGYLEGARYIVTWALGHLVELAPPEDYDKGVGQVGSAHAAHDSGEDENSGNSPVGQAVPGGPGPAAPERCRQSDHCD